MFASCADHCAGTAPPAPALRRALWVALWVNAAMFVVELAGGWAADSVALLADAADFFGDAAGSAPDAATMGAIALLALAANVGVAWMLYRFREGDANLRSVWLCSRNDAMACSSR
ncbi:MAG: cation transporter [Burkholderiales bacterium]|nr:cation transporter [Burkholderiales bacterium]